MIPVDPGRMERLVFKATYGWQIQIGPLLIRPDANDPTHRRILNYYWRGRYMLTSASWYVILNLGAKRHLFAFFMGRLHHREVR